MEYSIHELSRLAGVSARTLRYYQETGLLVPHHTNDAGYRFYGPDEVELLQQILFYRERGLSLEKIRSILYDEHFDRLSALSEHLEDLTRQQKRISNLICTVKQTIADMKGELSMSDKEKFEAFKQNMVSENEARYGAEIRKKYGDEEVDESNRRMLGMTQEEYDRFQALQETILKRLEHAVTAGISPEGEDGQEIALLHKEWLEYTWKTYSAQAHKGLVSMYLKDERFQSHYDQTVPGCTEFLVQAVTCWA